MPVTLGSEPEHGFNQPLGLMRDCHRRIEKFLGILLRIARENQGRPLDDERYQATEAALRYFRNAAPFHTRDEEDSLFPRMREIAHPQVIKAMTEIDRLESDHADADTAHAKVDQLCQRWIEIGMLEQADMGKLTEQLEQLCQMYQRHIAEEDDVIFPLAQRVLSASQVTAIGREMAERRGVDPGLPPRRCKHGRARRGP